MGLGPAKLFDVIENGDGEHLGLAWDVAADHHHHAEFAHRVGKAEHGRGEITGAGKGQDDQRKGLSKVEAEGISRFERAGADGGKAVAQRLDDEGQRIEHRADDQAREGEGEAASAPERGQPAARTGGAQKDEHIEPQNGWRQNERQGDQRVDDDRPARFRAGQPPGKGRADDHEDEGGDEGQREGEPDGRPDFPEQCHCSIVP